MNDIMSFVFPDGRRAFKLDTVMIDGEPWIFLADICRILEIKNASDATKDLDADEKGIVLNDTPGGMQKVLVVNESGFYGIIMRSRKPLAKPFQRWIRRELLPAIRKGDMHALARFAGVAGFRTPPATLAPDLRACWDAAQEVIEAGHPIDEQAADEIADRLDWPRSQVDRALLQLDRHGHLSVDIDAKAGATTLKSLI